MSQDHNLVMGYQNVTIEALNKDFYTPSSFISISRNIKRSVFFFQRLDEDGFNERRL